MVTTILDGDAQDVLWCDSSDLDVIAGFLDQTEKNTRTSTIAYKDLVQVTLSYPLCGKLIGKQWQNMTGVIHNCNFSLTFFLWGRKKKKTVCWLRGWGTQPRCTHRGPIPLSPQPAVKCAAPLPLMGVGMCQLFSSGTLHASKWSIGVATIPKAIQNFLFNTKE